MFRRHDTGGIVLFIIYDPTAALYPRDFSKIPHLTLAAPPFAGA